MGIENSKNETNLENTPRALSHYVSSFRKIRHIFLSKFKRIIFSRLAKQKLEEQFEQMLHEHQSTSKAVSYFVEAKKQNTFQDPLDHDTILICHQKQNEEKLLRDRHIKQAIYAFDHEYVKQELLQKLLVQFQKEHTQRLDSVLQECAYLKLLSLTSEHHFLREAIRKLQDYFNEHLYTLYEKITIIYHLDDFPKEFSTYSLGSSTHTPNFFTMFLTLREFCKRHNMELSYSPIEYHLLQQNISFDLLHIDTVVHTHNEPVYPHLQTYLDQCPAAQPMRSFLKKEYKTIQIVTKFIKNNEHIHLLSFFSKRSPTLGVYNQENNTIKYNTNVFIASSEDLDAKGINSDFQSVVLHEHMHFLFSDFIKNIKDTSKTVTYKQHSFTIHDLNEALAIVNDIGATAMHEPQELLLRQLKNNLILTKDKTYRAAYILFFSDLITNLIYKKAKQQSIYSIPILRILYLCSFLFERSETTLMCATKEDVLYMVKIANARIAELLQKFEMKEGVGHNL